MDIKDWKKRLAAVLAEHPSLGKEFTGQVEINMSVGGVTKLYRVETSTAEGGAVQLTRRQELK